MEIVEFLRDGGGRNFACSRWKQSLTFNGEYIERSESNPPRNFAGQYTRT